MAHTGLELTVDQRRVASSTREERAGPYTVIVATAIPELGLRLYSTYVASTAPRPPFICGSGRAQSAHSPSATTLSDSERPQR